MAELNDEERVALLEERLLLPPRALKPEIALEALRHGSWLGEHKSSAEGLRDNERLEILGDAVLGLLVLDLCCARFPAYTEGELTRLRASLVRAESLVEIARGVGLGDLLLLGRGEERGRGRERPNLLADALEAAVGAVYQSQGHAGARALVERLFGVRVEQALASGFARDFKTELQEKAQARHREAPTYRVLAAPGPEHARVFEVEASLVGQSVGRGSGRTKKEAEQAAAREALEHALIGGQPQPADQVTAPAPAPLAQPQAATVDVAPPADVPALAPPAPSDPSTPAG